MGVTGNHPIWSLDRQDWIGAGDLRIGERMRGGDSSLVLTARKHLTGKHTVYNLEVYRAHTFRVMEEGIWVHNECIWTSKSVRDAAKKLISGDKKVTVKNKAEAEELFLGLYLEKGHKNTTGFTTKDMKDKYLFPNGKSGTYHWDLNDTQHGRKPHLQIHDENGMVTRIFFEQ